jgi:hypothetical protein
MRFNPTRTHVAIVIIALLGLLLAGWWLVRPLWLTQTYGSILRDAVQKYSEVRGTIEGWRDPDVIAQVATGDALDYLLQVRCVDCASVQVATKINVEALKVMEYSPTISKVMVRVEWGWHKTDPNTGTVLGSCHAQAFTSIYVLTWEGSTWKVSGEGDTDRNPVDDSPELRAKYCGAD